MKNQHNIDQLLTSWGLSQRALPEHNAELKRKALASLATTAAAVRTSSSAPRHMPWLSVAFTGLAVLTLIVNAGGDTNTAFPVPASSPESPAYDAVTTSGAEMSLSKTSNQMAVPTMVTTRAVMPEYYPMPPTPQSATIEDTREFLKTSYNATLRTRDVTELTRRVTTTVRGFGGRVDSSNSSEKWGSVSFALPADKFDAFQEEIESLVSRKFINVETYAQNLLTQKQSIEEQQKQVDKNLVDLKARRQQLVSSHARTVSTLQSQLDTLAYQIATAQNQQLLQSFLIQQGDVQSRLSSENSSYSKQLSYADENIKAAESSKEWVAKQDQNLLDNVATVEGTISINWISIWEVVTTYVSMGWIVVILLAGAASSYWFDRRRNKLELI